MKLLPTKYWQILYLGLLTLNVIPYPVTKNLKHCNLHNVCTSTTSKRAKVE